MRHTPEEMARELLQAGIIDDATAQRIRAHYAERQEEAGSKSKLPGAFSIIGTVFLGVGLLLLIAHNWQDLPRWVRLLLAFVPLLIGQGLSVFALKRRAGSATWRESAAMVVFFGVGASFALISQTYHLGGQLKDLLLVWSLLALPIAYLMRASVVGLFTLTLVIWHDALRIGPDYPPVLSLLSALAFIPLLLNYQKDNRPKFLLESYRLFILLAVAIPFYGWFIDNETVVSLGYLVLYGALFALTFNHIPRAPFRYFDSWVLLANIGLGVMVVVQFVMYRLSSFVQTHHPIEFNTQTAIVITFLSLVYVGLGIRWLMTAPAAERWSRPLLFLPLAMIGVEILGRTGNPGLAYTILNLSLVALSALLIYLGFRRSSYAQLNHGLLTALLVSINFFFETDLSYTLRGLVFILVGAGFIAGNIMLSRQKAKMPPATLSTSNPNEE